LLSNARRTRPNADVFDEAVEMERIAEKEMGFDDAWLLRVPKKAPSGR